VGLDGIRVPGQDAFVMRRPRSVQLPPPAHALLDLTERSGRSADAEAVQRAHA